MLRGFHIYWEILQKPTFPQLLQKPIQTDQNLPILFRGKSFSDWPFTIASIAEMDLVVPSGFLIVGLGDRESIFLTNTPAELLLDNITQVNDEA